jgi:hypothetical protein
MVELHAACHEILGRILHDRQERVPPIADIALQQTATGSRSHSHLCALQQKIKTVQGCFINQ